MDKKREQQIRWLVYIACVFSISIGVFLLLEIYYDLRFASEYARSAVHVAERLGENIETVLAAIGNVVDERKVTLSEIFINNYLSLSIGLTSGLVFTGLTRWDKPIADDILEKFKNKKGES